MPDDLPIGPRALGRLLLALLLEIEREEGRWEDDGGAAVGEGQETSARLLLPYHADAVRIQEHLDDWWLSRLGRDQIIRRMPGIEHS